MYLHWWRWIPEHLDILLLYDASNGEYVSPERSAQSRVIHY